MVNLQDGKLVWLHSIYKFPIYINFARIKHNRVTQFEITYAKAGVSANPLNIDQIPRVEYVKQYFIKHIILFDLQTKYITGARQDREGPAGFLICLDALPKHYYFI